MPYSTLRPCEAERSQVKRKREVKLSEKTCVDCVHCDCQAGRARRADIKRAITIITYRGV